MRFGAAVVGAEGAAVVGAEGAAVVGGVEELAVVALAVVTAGAINGLSAVAEHPDKGVPDKATITKTAARRFVFVVLRGFIQIIPFLYGFHYFCLLEFPH